MQKEVKKSWALFIGIGTMMIAHGLQMQIMGIRSVLEDFSVFTTYVKRPAPKFKKLEQLVLKNYMKFHL